jgi:hypothetical protein
MSAVAGGLTRQSRGRCRGKAKELRLCRGSCSMVDYRFRELVIPAG